MLVCSFSSAQKNASDKIKPQWIGDMPVSPTSDISFISTTIYSTDLQSSPGLSLNELTRNIPRTWNVKTSDNVSRVSVTERADGKIVANDRVQTYSLDVEANGRPVEIRCKQEDTYWEQEQIGGNLQYKYYTLFQIVKPESSMSFIDTHTTTSYGLQGLWRSIIPGCGQFYKGSTMKGVCFLGCTAALIGGTAFCNSKVKNYQKLSVQYDSTSDRQFYSKRISDYTTYRNVCLCTGIAAYIWNLADAALAPGARRIVISPTTDGISSIFTF